MALPGYLKRFTVAYYLQGLVPHAMPSDSPLSLHSVDLPRVADAGREPDLAGRHRGGVPLAGGPDVARREYVLEQ